MRYPRIQKVSAEQLCPAACDAPAARSAVLLRCGSAGRDLLVPRGRHAWRVDHGDWHDYYLTRREAREVLGRAKEPR